MSRAECVLRASSTDERTADLLDLTTGDPILELTETVFDQYSEPFEIRPPFEPRPIGTRSGPLSWRAVSGRALSDSRFVAGGRPPASRGTDGDAPHLLLVGAVPSTGAGNVPTELRAPALRQLEQQVRLDPANVAHVGMSTRPSHHPGLRIERSASCTLDRSRTIGPWRT